MFAPVKASQFFAYLSSKHGFAAVLGPMLAFGSLGLMTEGFYKIMPETSWAIPKEQRAFAIKPGIEDSAELARLFPFKGVVYAPIRYVAPEIIKPMIPRAEHKSVLFDPLFWISFGIAAAVQYKEKELFQRESYETVKARAVRSNKMEKMTVNTNAISVAKIDTMNHNNYGLGDKTKNGAAIIGLYASEFVFFILSLFGTGTNFFVAFFYAAYSAFGFEIFWTRPLPTIGTLETTKRRRRRRRRKANQSPSPKNVKL